MIPEGPFESPLGPYTLSWVQDNGTQVREESPLRASRPLATEWLSLVGLGVVGWAFPHPPKACSFHIPHRLHF